MPASLNGQGADVRDVHVDHRLERLELEISEVLVHKTVAEDALRSRSIGIVSIMGPLGGRTSLRKETAALPLHARSSVGIGQRAFHRTSASVRCD